ncbi:hypothetical protein [Halalkalicoccus sp. NIPERK01]|uniref:hypothetical protein n=1 Tax=Halalkalicoccus sp. NIPERK01 TaxID=3053469 RepID=UPI00256ED61D|nr:hypothetical protein [Halalkalicoccus sp. NIPERK01]MDL5363283.1 hypothetical protein [Halalkalicoccus sp. NIPERK01]
MTHPSSDPVTLARLPALIETLSERLEALTSAIVAESDDEEVVELAETLWTVVEEAIDVIETVDFEGLPDAIDGDELPDAIEVEKLADALETGDATEAVDLAELHEAIDLWKLWEAVDVPALRTESEELEAEIAVALGDEEDAGGTSVVDETANALFTAESRQRALQQRLDAALDAFRVRLLETHLRVRRLYDANRRNPGGSGAHRPRRGRTMPRGPLPDSASTRASTVPTRARHSRTKGRPRIYGRRFERMCGR